MIVAEFPSGSTIAESFDGVKLSVTDSLSRTPFESLSTSTPRNVALSFESETDDTSRLGTRLNPEASGVEPRSRS